MGLTSAAREALTDLLGNLAVLATLALTIPLLAGRPAGALYLAVPSLLVLAGFEAVRPLGPAAQTFERIQAAGSRLLVIGDRRLELPEPVTALAPPTVGCLSFDRVTFTYPDARRPALQDVTFIIPAGGRIAVVGPSGAGKTTLVQLLLRFRDPSGGAITLDGADIRGYRPADLRAVMAVVGQDTYLFDDTVRANLLLACPDVTEAELVDALAAARLGELVQALPRGLNTPIGEHGARLSGGERQRLAIARAFLQDAPLLILDEPTANLDPLTEWDVLDSLHQLMRGRTTLLITHRLVRMEEMDEIAVLNQGCIVECGSHADLCARRGLYRSMLDVQSDTIPSYPL